MTAPLDAHDPAGKATVLVVDDTADNLSIMSGLLRDDYRVKVASSGEKALKIAAGNPPPDLILLDIMMPRMDGYEVCRRLKADPKTREIPVIFLTAKAEVEDEQKGLDLRAVDYITKPISPPIVLARVKTHLALKASADFLRDKNAYLEAEINRRVEELDKVQDIFGKVVDTRVRDYLLQGRRRLGGDITEGAVMFCDIRGFTAYSESRDPRQVIEFLNRFFSGAAASVEREGGFVNKYLGDAFMAVFGTPFPLEDFGPGVRRSESRSLRQRQPREGSASAWASTPARWSRASSGARAAWSSRSSATPSTRRAGWKACARTTGSRSS
jgi:CheY-like chemotaxis protein